MVLGTAPGSRGSEVKWFGELPRTAQNVFFVGGRKLLLLFSHANKGRALQREY